MFFCVHSDGPRNRLVLEENGANAGARSQLEAVYATSALPQRAKRTSIDPVAKEAECHQTWRTLEVTAQPAVGDSTDGGSALGNQACWDTPTTKIRFFSRIKGRAKSGLAGPAHKYVVLHIRLP